MAGFKIVFIDIGKQGEINMDHLRDEVIVQIWNFIERLHLYRLHIPGKSAVDDVFFYISYRLLKMSRTFW